MTAVFPQDSGEVQSPEKKRRFGWRDGVLLASLVTCAGAMIGIFTEIEGVDSDTPTTPTEIVVTAGEILVSAGSLAVGIKVVDGRPSQEG